MRVRVAAFALLVLASGCRTLSPVHPLPAGDPRPRALLDAWRASTEDRRALFAVAQLAVDAPGAGVGGDDLSLRSKQRLWLARPARLRVEVLGFFDTTVAVLTTDGTDYAFFEAEDRRFESGPVYEGLLWDAAHLRLSPSEVVEVILGASHPDAGLVSGAAQEVRDGVRIELVGADRVVRRVVEFDAEGRLRRLEQRSEDGVAVWEAAWDDYADLDGEPFARRMVLRSAAGDTEARLFLRRVELNPAFSPELFRLRVPAVGGALEGGAG